MKKAASIPQESWPPGTVVSMSPPLAMEILKDDRFRISEILAVSEDPDCYDITVLGINRQVLGVPANELERVFPPDPFIVLTDHTHGNPIDVIPKHIRAITSKRNVNNEWVCTIVVVESGPNGALFVKETREQIKELMARHKGWPDYLD